MKHSLVALAVLAAMPVAAEMITIDGQVQVRPANVELPKRGTSMTAVEARFGAPRTKHAAVGSPPITRWEYENFNVYFEHQHVVHAVASGG